MGALNRLQNVCHLLFCFCYFTLSFLKWLGNTWLLSNSLLNGSTPPFPPPPLSLFQCFVIDSIIWNFKTEARPSLDLLDQKRWSLCKNRFAQNFDKRVYVVYWNETLVNKFRQKNRVCKKNNVHIDPTCLLFWSHSWCSSLPLISI